MRFLVLGAGTQGSAAAYDLLSVEGGSEVTIADLDLGGLHPALTPHLGGRLRTVVLDANCSSEVLAAMEGADGVLSALPYYFNAEMARLALDSGCHFTDLGGNTAVVEEQQKLDARARSLGLSIVADVGLAPGMVNVLAQGGIDRLESTESVRMWVGGLPQHPRPPLNYQIVYSLEGMLDYYVTPAEILRAGRRVTVEALSGLETVDFPPPIGPPRGLLHRRGGFDAARALRRTDRHLGVQDAPVSRPCLHNAHDPRSRAAERPGDRLRRHTGQPSALLHTAGHPPPHQQRRRRHGRARASRQRASLPTGRPASATMSWTATTPRPGSPQWPELPDSRSRSSR